MPAIKVVLNSAPKLTEMAYRLDVSVPAIAVHFLGESAGAEASQAYEMGYDVTVHEESAKPIPVRASVSLGGAMSLGGAIIR